MTARSNDDEKQARADAARMMKRMETILRRLIAENPDVDRARLEVLFLDAVTADPVLGEVVWQEGFWDAVNEIRRKEERR
jgi:hypothetical protein